MEVRCWSDAWAKAKMKMGPAWTFVELFRLELAKKVKRLPRDFFYPVTWLVEKAKKTIRKLL